MLDGHTYSCLTYNLTSLCALLGKNIGNWQATKSISTVLQRPFLSKQIQCIHIFNKLKFQAYQNHKQLTSKDEATVPDSTYKTYCSDPGMICYNREVLAGADRRKEGGEVFLFWGRRILEKVEQEDQEGCDFTLRRSCRAWLRLWSSGWLESRWERDPTGNSLWKKTRQEGKWKSNLVFFLNGEKSREVVSSAERSRVIF